MLVPYTKPKKTNRLSRLDISRRVGRLVLDPVDSMCLFIGRLLISGITKSLSTTNGSTLKAQKKVQRLTFGCMLGCVVV
ncbi:hypothetical protein VCR20J5_740108 [Vibrio crassostreae]|nr:hypothetical protein VCR20J5_740108 [Vibrio crassostreae]